jgi:drug/metabolite transporter (DMT)-like permease
VGATILAFFILKETPAMMEIVGGLLILAGIGIAFTTPPPNPTNSKYEARNSKQI